VFDDGMEKKPALDGGIHRRSETDSAKASTNQPAAKAGRDIEFGYTWVYITYTTINEDGTFGMTKGGNRR